MKFNFIYNENNKKNRKKIWGTRPGSNHLPKSWNSYEVENLPDAIIDGVHVAAISNLDKKH